MDRRKDLVLNEPGLEHHMDKKFRSLTVKNPRTGQPDYQIPDHDADFVARQAAELRQAQDAWLDLGLEGRCRALGEWRDAMLRHSEAITNALCIDTGRYLMAKIETLGTLHRIDHWISRAPELMRQFPGGRSAMVPSVNYRYQLRPYPLVGVISPVDKVRLEAAIEQIKHLALVGSVTNQIVESTS